MKNCALFFVFEKGFLMPTQLDICNVALLKLGENPLTDMNDPSAAATLANALFTQAAWTLLASYPWRFATETFELASTTQEFDLPSNVVRVLEVNGNPKFDVSGNKILSTGNIVSVTAIVDNGGANYPHYFCNLLSLKLAEEFCIPLCDNQQLMRTLRDLFQSESKNAKFIDGQSGDTAARSFSLVSERF
jgi:hypothetical protein